MEWLSSFWNSTDNSNDIKTQENINKVDANVNEVDANVDVDVNEWTDLNSSSTSIEESNEKIENPYINLFLKASRDSDDEFLTKNIESALLDNAVRTSKLIFFIRDRLAKNERKPLISFYRYLVENSDEYVDYDRFIKNSMLYIAEYGYWKDLLVIFSGTKYEDLMVRVYCMQLQLDELNMNNGKPASLAAKYIPAEGNSFDRKYNLAKKFQSELDIASRREYRQYRTRMLKNINISTRYDGRTMLRSDLKEILNEQINEGNDVVSLETIMNRSIENVRYNDIENWWNKKF
jgi:hypothetical protein